MIYEYKKYESDGQHAKRAPSSCNRWGGNCLGSIRLSEGAEDVTSKYAAEGTLAHDICSKLLTREIKSPKSLYDLIGDTHMVEDFEIEITEEMVEGCIMYLEEMVKLFESTGIPLDQLDQVMHVEQRVQIGKDCFGTSDVFIASSMDCLIVVDFKYGAGVAVDIEGNKQLLCYALGAWNYADRDRYIDKIIMGIVQPRAIHKDGPVRYTSITLAELEDFETDLNGWIAKTEEPDAPCKQGTWCRWCPAQYKCPELFNEVEELSVAIEKHEENLLPVVESLAPEKLAKIMEIQPIMTDYFKTIKQHCIGMLSRGEEVPGYKLVVGKGSRSWKNEDKAEKIMVNAGISEPFEKKLLSPAKAEKALKSDAAVTAKRAKEMLEKYIEKIAGAPTIAQAGDTRKALTSAGPAAFDDGKV